LLAQAAHQASRQQFSAAKEWLQQAIAIDSSYAPTFLAYADLGREQFRVGEISESVARQEIRRRFRQAESLETDWQLRAELKRELRQHLLEFGQVQEAIEAAESYASSAPTVSTYLRDQKLAAEAFAWEQRGLLGYVAESLPFFAEQVAQRPQDYRLLLQYARLLRLEGSYAEADSVLLPAHRLLVATGSPRADVLLALAENALALGDTTQANVWTDPVRKGEVRVWNRLDWIGLLTQLKDTSTAQAWFAGMVRPTLPDQRSQYEYARALLQAAAGEEEIATLALVSALKANPYHFPARMRLIHRLVEAGEKDQARSWARQGVSLPLPAGPVWRKQLAPFVKTE
jgi:Tfp pilus assembly protein PilF